MQLLNWDCCNVLHQAFGCIGSSCVACSAKDDLRAGGSWHIGFIDGSDFFRELANTVSGLGVGVIGFVEQSSQVAGEGGNRHLAALLNRIRTRYA